MKHRTTRRLAALALGAALVLAGCSDGGSTGDDASPSATDAATGAATPSAEDVAALDAVTVTGDPGAEPTVEFTAPLEVSAPTSRIVDEGTGADITDGQQVTIHYVAFNGTDGSKIGSTWEGDPEKFVLGDASYGLLNEPLTGQKVGTRLLLANPSQDSSGNPATILNLVEVTDVKDVPGVDDVPQRSEGTPVTPPEGLPVVTLDDTGTPSIDIPDGYEAPSDLVAQTLIEGDGPEVTADQTVIAHYTGWLTDGTVFDSSWERGEPTSFPLSGVIQGWTQGLTGQKVGSQVLLVIPPSLGYGDQESGSIPAGSTLIFVVDILGAY